MRWGKIFALTLALAAGMAQAQGLDQSLRPRPRPVLVAVSAQDQMPELQEIVELAAVASPSSLRPMPRPGGVAGGMAAAPKPRRGLAALFNVGAVRSQPGAESVLPKKGSVCGDPAIRGEAIAPIVGKVKGCGVAEAVRVTAVDGIRLSEPATIDCATAAALKAWVRDGLKPAFGRSEVVEMQVAGHYVCRPRNNIRGKRISEHGRGKAIDISGFTLADGRQVAVARDWRRDHGSAIKAAHRAACGIFGTTLGPGSDGHHEDHLHFDTAQHRNGAYCR